jgi:hypothetical protein
VASTGFEPGDEVAAPLVEGGLKLLHHAAVRAFAKCWRLSAVTAERRPRGWPDDPVNGELAVVLELLHRCFGHLTEDAIDLVVAQGPADEKVLQPPDSGSSCAL